MKDSPSIPTLVLLLVAVAASTLENSPASSAVRPNAVRASVTMSETVAKSSPLAAAKSIIGARPSSMASVFQPAIAIYCMACPASVAVKALVEPISIAA